MKNQSQNISDSFNEMSRRYLVIPYRLTELENFIEMFNDSDDGVSYLTYSNKYLLEKFKSNDLRVMNWNGDERKIKNWTNDDLKDALMDNNLYFSLGKLQFVNIFYPYISFKTESNEEKK